MSERSLQLRIVNDREGELTRLRTCLAANDFGVRLERNQLLFRREAARQMQRCIKSLVLCAQSRLLALPGWTRLQLLLLEITPLDCVHEPSLELRIMLKDADHLELSSGLRQAIGLSDSEAALARALACGISLDGYAVRQKLSKNTVRTQASIIRRKTGARSQAQIASLVWLLCSGSSEERGLVDEPLVEGLLVRGF